MPRLCMDYKPAYDYSRLRGKIREVFGTEQKFAKAMNRSANFISSVFNGTSYFDQRDIDRAAELLEIPPAEMPYFFWTKVHIQ